jgi:hypothetical protein
MEIEPTEEARNTIEHWLQTHLLEELGSWDMLPQVIADFPENTGRVHPTALKGVKSIDLGSMRLKSLSQSVVNATLSVTLSFGLYVSKEDYDASQEVRDFVGEQDGDFYGIHTLLLGRVLLIALIKKIAIKGETLSRVLNGANGVKFKAIFSK